MKIGISFLKSNYDFYKTIELIDKSNADFIHVDVMDGLFVNNKTIYDKQMIISLKEAKKPKDVHLMTLHLEKYIDLFSYINPEYITFQYEATTKINEMIDYIKSKNCKVGIAINPLTEVDVLIPYLNKIDLVLIMSVIPGYGGQKFIRTSVDKIEKLYDLRDKYKANFKINIDGGINDKTISTIPHEKLDIAVSGSYVCKDNDFNKKIATLKE